MKPFAAKRAFTLAETMISLGASAMVIGALMLGASGLQKASHTSGTYNTAQSDLRRLVDYLARDLRRAIAVAATDDSGAPAAVATEPVSIAERATLGLTLPGYYKSDVPTNPDFTEPMPVVPSSGGPAYGGTAGPAPGVMLSFRKVFVADEGSVCFVRQEADAKQVIVRRAENVYARVTLSRDGSSAVIEAWIRSSEGGVRPLASTCDQVVLRNMRTDTPR